MKNAKRIGRTAVVLVALTAVSLAPARAQSKPSSKGGNASPKRVEAIDDAILNRIWDIADMHWHKGEYNHIINLSQMVLSGQPDQTEVYANVGWLLWSMNRDAEAVALYERGLKANPNTWYLYDELGHYYYNRKKDYPRAISYYEKAVKFKDCQFMSFHMLAHAYERTKQLDKALETWKIAAEKETKPGPAHNNLNRVKRLIEQQGGQRQ